MKLEQALAELTSMQMAEEVIVNAQINKIKDLVKTQNDKDILTNYLKTIYEKTIEDSENAKKEILKKHT